MKKRKLIDRLACCLLVSIAQALKKAGYNGRADCCHGGAVLGDYVNGRIVDVVYFTYEGEDFGVSVSNNDPPVCVNRESTGSHDWTNDSTVVGLLKAADELMDQDADSEAAKGGT